MTIKIKALCLLCSMTTGKGETEIQRNTNFKFDFWQFHSQAEYPISEMPQNRSILDFRFFHILEYLLIRNEIYWG